MLFSSAVGSARSQGRQAALALRRGDLVSAFFHSRLAESAAVAAKPFAVRRTPSSKRLRLSSLKSLVIRSWLALSEEEFSEATACLAEALCWQRRIAASRNGVAVSAPRGWAAWLFGAVLGLKAAFVTENPSVKL